MMIYKLKKFDDAFPKNEQFNRKKFNFNTGDGVYIPAMDASDMFRKNNFMIKISTKKTHIYAKAIGYDSPNGSIVIPEWMFDYLESNRGDIVHMSSENIEPILNVKIVSSKNISDPVSILEFELRKRNVLSIGDKISSKIFEKSYDFTIKEIKTRTGISNVGALYDNNIVSNINFEIEYE